LWHLVLGRITHPVINPFANQSENVPQVYEKDKSAHATKFQTKLLKSHPDNL